MCKKNTLKRLATPPVSLCVKVGMELREFFSKAKKLVRKSEAFPSLLHM
jgi:hypothetical protein